MTHIRRISVVGPESSGKTTLSRQLAEHFRGAWLPEFARSYLDGKKEYGRDDLLHILAGQQEQERIAVQALADGSAAEKPWLFLDTCPLVIRIWSEVRFGYCNLPVLDALAEHTPDLYILCQPDLRWEEDPLREHPDPHDRQRLFHFYQESLIQQPVPWIRAVGEGPQRWKDCARNIVSLFQ